MRAQLLAVRSGVRRAVIAAILEAVRNRFGMDGVLRQGALERREDRRRLLPLRHFDLERAAVSAVDQRRQRYGVVFRRPVVLRSVAPRRFDSGTLT